MQSFARQRPGQPSGFIFISSEDETGISNAVSGGKFLLIEGVLQNQDDVVSVKASSIRVLDLGSMDKRSHHFH